MPTPRPIPAPTAISTPRPSPAPRRMRRPRLRPLALALLVGAAAAGPTACDRVLQVEPEDRIPAEQQLTDLVTARAALVGAYDALQAGGYYGLDVLLLGDLPSDNGQWAGTYQFLGNVADNEIGTDNAEVTALWTAIYAQIARDNLLLARVPQVPGVPAAEREAMLGDAHFLRALGFHNLTKFWGEVPLPLAPVTSAAEAARFTRAPVAQVYAQILADLDAAAARVTNTSDTRRVTVAAVGALRARVLLYRASLAGNAAAAADLQGALDAADAVLAGRTTLPVPYGDLFAPNGASTAEDVFRVSFTPQESNSLGYYWRWNGRHEAVPTNDLANAYEPGDLRRALTVAPRTATSTRWQGVKWPTTVGAEHPHVIRLAELMLIRAEVLARQGRLADAVAAYNPVRVRAGLAPHVLGTEVTDAASVRAAIDRERRLELALEGDRWPDLIRQGRAAEVKELADPRRALFPVPQREIDAASGMTQNPGYST